jgi:2-polyprenyl-3-methyl-5-hydroxy-6-metoxy-1,4-benzoquinol methylase
VSAPCPLCGSVSDPAFTVGDRNRAITDRRFEYRRCLGCGTRFLIDVPEDLARYYPEAYYVLPSLAQLDQAARGEAPKLALVRRFVEGGRMIEIGAGLGIFARAATQAGFDLTVIEMDARCCEYLEQVVGVRAIRSDAPEQALAGLGPVRAVALWHVLEHLPRPWEVLERAVEQLEPGGVLVLAMPNPESFQFRVLGARWAHIDAPRHLFLIPFAALASKADELGLDLGEVTTTDPAGRYWNMFGWEYAIRRYPSRHPSSRLTRVGSRLLALALAPVERGGLRGAAYTAVFVKR